MGDLAYCTVGSNDLGAAKTFYDSLLELVGLNPLFEHPSGGRVYGRGGAFSVAVLGPSDGQIANVGNGTMVGKRDEVDAFMIV